jgi:predicted nucleotide-binding protein
MRSTLNFALSKAEEDLGDRINRGNEIMQNLLNDPSQSVLQYDKYETWKEYNIELLGRMFTRSTYKTEYLGKIRHTIASRLHYRIRNAQGSLREEIRYLSSLVQRLPLIEQIELSPGREEIAAKPDADLVIFIGHGRSQIWKDLRDFIRDRLRMPFEEFNRVPSAGIPVTDRLTEMLARANFAFLVLTGEDEQADGSLNARLNVVHEAGLFQGKLGFRRAIVLLEEGCQEFSNIHGLGQIRFPEGNIAAKFEEIRQVLEREGLLPPTG